MQEQSLQLVSCGIIQPLVQNEEFFSIGELWNYSAISSKRRIRET
jgi:hypothetical protein